METVAPPAPATAAPAAATAPAAPALYQLTQQTLLSPHEYRRWKSDYETIRRGCAMRLSLLFRTEVELELTALETPTCRQFTSQLSQPTHLTLFKIEPWRGLGVLEIEPSLALVLLDRLMGGAGEQIPPIRELTEIETALLGQVTDLITEAWALHWQGIKDLKPVALGTENDPRYLQFAAPEAPLLAASFVVRLGEISGRIALAMPLAMLEPLLEKIRTEVKPPPAPTAPPTGAPPPARPAWHPALDHVTLAVSAELPGPEITGRQLQALRVGDVLSLPMEAGDQVQLRLSGVPRFTGRLGTQDDHWAVQVLQALKG